MVVHGIQHRAVFPAGRAQVQGGLAAVAADLQAGTQPARGQGVVVKRPALFRVEKPLDRPRQAPVHVHHGPSSYPRASTSRGLAPSDGPTTPSFSMISMMRAARL